MSFEVKETTVRQVNIEEIEKDHNCQLMINKMCEIECFLSSFSFLTFGRDFILCGNRPFSLQKVITSAELTVGSIISCCKAACIADANSLLRKYRDDLFFYLYVIIFDINSKLETEIERTTEMQTQIEKWLNNCLVDLKISKVMKAIGTSPAVKDAVKQYNLQKYFDNIGSRLNNYMHSNGYEYYNCNINSYQANELCTQMETLLNDMRYITVSFLFLLILCRPLSIMSSDYTDYLDCGETPPSNSQNWVAPFVTTFIERHIDVIDDNCYLYLKSQTLMKF